MIDSLLADLTDRVPTSDDLSIAPVVLLAKEISVLRDRIDTLERLLYERGVVEEGAVETFSPSREAESSREAERRRLISELLRAIVGPARTIDDGAYAALIEDVSR